MSDQEQNAADQSLAPDERRSQPRVALEVPAWVASDGARIHTVTQDLSVGGVRMRAQTEWSTSDEVHLALSLPETDSPLELNGKVAWRQGDWVGVSFVDVPEDAEKVLQHRVNVALGLESGSGDNDSFDFENASSTVEISSLKS